MRHDFETLRFKPTVKIRDAGGSQDWKCQKKPWTTATRCRALCFTAKKESCFLSEDKTQKMTRLFKKKTFPLERGKLRRSLFKKGGKRSIEVSQKQANLANLAKIIGNLFCFPFAFVCQLSGQWRLYVGPSTISPGLRQVPRAAVPNAWELKAKSDFENFLMKAFEELWKRLKSLEFTN